MGAVRGREGVGSSDDGPGFNDARQINRQTLSDYAEHLRNLIEHGDLAIATAQNRLSSVNRTMAALCADQYVKMPKPSKALEKQRPTVRTKAPQGQDREQVMRVVEALRKQIPRAIGMRLRKALLADLPRLSREAEHCGNINIQDGTKGGRSGATAPRWVHVNDRIREALNYAEQVSLHGSRNLLAPDENYLDIQQRVVRPARDILHTYNLKGFHKLRAAYACERYEKITNHLAPINSGKCYQFDPYLDREARFQISYELGHGRIDVVSAYVGGTV